MHDEVIADVERFLKTEKKYKPYFTVEMGRGETYTGGPTLYGHSEYERSSVLAGQPKRCFLESWETWEEANAAIAAVRVKFPKVDIEVNAPSSFISSDELCDRAGLPHDEDY